MKIGAPSSPNLSLRRFLRYAIQLDLERSGLLTNNLKYIGFEPD